VSIHELGHLVFARWFGMKVEQYSVGMGPKLWSRYRGETEYAVKAFPIGGSVRIAGMNPFENVPPDDYERTYGAKPAWQRALVIFAGPGTHAIVAALLFASSFWIFGHDVEREHLLITQVQELHEGGSSPARAAGVHVGDQILRIGDVASPDSEELQTALRASIGSSIDLLVLRGGEQLQLEVTPQLAVVEGQELARMGVIVELFESRPVGPVEGLVLGTGEIGPSVVLSLQTVGRVFGPEGVGSVFRALFTDEPRDVQGPTSVIGIGQAVGEAGTDGRWEPILQTFAFATIFVGLINLVPLPPFDGGHLLLLAIERVRGRPVDFRRVVPISVAVIALLAIFVGATMILDIAEPITRSP
jgi:membrane-associated protease RseP (regulator of RpoE activity)